MWCRGYDADDDEDDVTELGRAGVFIYMYLPPMLYP